MAQKLKTSIVGTWKIVSQNGTDADGKPFNADLSKITQYKIITPTHWMYVSHNSEEEPDNKVGGDGGTYTLVGDKYVENLTDGYKTDFTVKVEGDKYYQDGAIIFPDGKKAIFHEVYQRIQEPANMNKDLIGTWELVSLQVTKDGKQEAIKGLTDLHIITPSHYMYVRTWNGKYSGASVGTYIKEGDTIKPTPIISPNPEDNENIELKVSVKGDQMTTNGKHLKKDGTLDQWVTVHQKVTKAQLAKTVSTKKVNN
jgi:hypothetical protein